MSVLAELWPGTAGIPRVPIIDAPTPVVPLTLLSDRLGAQIWCKRDDLTASGYGGNKARKLEFLLGEARRRHAHAVVTTGAWGSHHVLATAYHGTKHGFEVHAVLAPQPWTDHVGEILRADLAAGAVLHPVHSFPAAAPGMLSVGGRLRVQKKRPYLIGPGGSTDVGTGGYVEAGLELARQIERRELPEPDAIYVAIGSGGSAVGIALGLAAAGITTRIVAMCVTGRVMVNDVLVRRLMKKTWQRLHAADSRFPEVVEMATKNLVLDRGELGDGYGWPTDGAKRACVLAAREGIVLDPTYTAKAFAGVVRDAIGPAQKKTLLYWHTLSSADLGPLLSTAPPLPDWAVRAARGSGPA